MKRKTLRFGKGFNVVPGNKRSTSCPNGPAASAAWKPDDRIALARRDARADLRAATTVDQRQRLLFRARWTIVPGDEPARAGRRAQQALSRSHRDRTAHRRGRHVEVDRFLDSSVSRW